jgi:PKD repeat protein
MQLDILAQSRKVYAEKDRIYQFPTLVRHQGVAIAFSMDSTRRIYYAVLDLSPDPATQQTGAAAKTSDVDAWPTTPELLIFPPEIAEVGFRAIGQQTMDVFRKGANSQAEPAGTILPIGDRARPNEFDYFRSTTASLTANARFQVLSDGTFIYVFRQSTDADASLLVDRFLLVGRKLESKLEVRFQRSRRQGVPQNKKDTLGSHDLDGNPFVEPTQKLGFIRDLTNGHFSVLLTPTQIAAVQRWQIFAENAATGRMDAYNIERSEDGLFNTRGTVADSDDQGGESALNLKSDTMVTLDKSVPLATDFTIEAWLNPAAGGAADQVLLSSPAQALVRLRDRVQILVAGQLAGNLGTGWTHVAIVRRSGQISVFTGGRLRELQPFPETAPGPTQETVVRLGGPAFKTARLLANAGDPNADIADLLPGYSGMIDELRIWDRARSFKELTADMNQRLTGIEPGLTLYLRFDEGRGKRAFDQTRSGAHGTIADPANQTDKQLWPLSGAPLVESPGIERHSFGFQGRALHSAPSAILYFQQSTEIRSGYNNRPKPLKQNGRIMLAVATSTDSDDKPFIAVLDFAVSASGRIPKTPDVVALQTVSVATATPGPDLNELLQSISEQEEQRRFLEAELANVPVTPATFTAAITAARKANAGRPAALDTAFLTSYLAGFPTVPPAEDFRALSQILSALQQSAETLLRLTGANPVDAKAVTEETSKFKALQGKLSLEEGVLADLPIAKLTAAIAAADNATVAETQALDTTFLTSYVAAFPVSPAGSEFRVLNEIFVELKHSVSDPQNVDEARFRSFQTKLTAEKTALQARGAEIETARTSLTTRLAAVNARLTALQSSANSGASAAMKPVHLDPTGLSISGGVLDFAFTNDAPVLFDSATGKLALYFRGSDNQFFVAYYETFTTRAKCPLGPVDCLARATERELDRLTVEVTGAGNGVCDVAIVGAGINEAWKAVPTAPQLFANVLNGAASIRSKVGQGSFSADGKTLNMSQLTQDIDDGALLVVGDVRVNAKKALRGSATIELKLAPSTTVPLEPRPIFLQAYDYTQATSSLPTADLENGSSLIFVAPPSGSAAIDNITVTAGATISSQWVADAPGDTLNFDGRQVAKLKDTSHLNALNSQDDLTLECWVRPVRVSESAAVLVEHPDYSLSLLPADLNSALVLGSASVELPFSSGLPVGDAGDFTIECWARLADATEQTILFQAHDFSVLVGLDGVITAAYNGTTFNSTTKIIDRLFHHIALTLDTAGLLTLFIDGDEDNSASTTPVPRAQIKTSIFVGAGELGETPFIGEIDEIRLWGRRRSAEQIHSDMHRRLAGNETGLRGCWTFSGGVANDLSRFRNPAKIVGKAVNAPSPLGGFRVAATVHGQVATAQDTLAFGNWTQVAATYGRGYAVVFDGKDEHLDCGEGASLNIPGDLTIEVFADLKEINRRQMIVRKGRFDDEDSTQKPPYALFVDDKNQLTFSLMDVKGNIYKFASKSTLSKGFHHIAVTRERKTEAETHQNTESSTTIFDAIKLYIDGVDAGVALDSLDVFLQLPDSHRYEGVRRGSGPPKAGVTRKPEQVATSSRALTIASAGKLGESLIDGWNGNISEVRIWNHARTPEEIAKRAPLRDDQGGLAGWWRFRERDGPTIKDASGNRNDATIKGGAWVVATDPLGGDVSVLVNGIRTPIDILPSKTEAPTSFAVGRDFQGELEEMRIWRTARTPEQVQDNLFGRVRDEVQDLLAYYKFDPTPQTAPAANAAADADTTTDAARLVPDSSLALNDLQTAVAGSFILSTAPIGEDGPQVRNALAGIRSPFSGFIESGPAVHEYADAQLDSRGNLIGVFKRVYSYVLDQKWNLVTGYKVGDLATEWVGQVQFNPELLGYIEGAPPVPSENLTSGSVAAIGDLDDYNGASSIRLVEAEDKTYTFAATRDAGLKLSIEASLKFGGGGQISAVEAPLGIGVSEEILDTSLEGGPKISIDTAFGWLDEASLAFGLTTGKATSLELRGRFGAGEEINIKKAPRLFIPENLGQALVKSETADVFALRLRHNGALIAYQFRPNPDIPKDINILSFRIDPTYTSQGTLDGKVGSEAHLSFLNALEPGSNASYFKPLEAYKLKAAIDKKAADLQTLYDQYDALGNTFSSSFAAGSLGDRYRPIREAKAKRSLVNTYVWTADGGLYAETQESSDTLVESTGGSFEFTGGAGVDLNFHLEAGVAFDFALNIMASGYYKLEEKKSAESKTAYSMDVDIEKVERDILLRDESGQTVMRNNRARRAPGKVDAYRFMTFRLEPTSDSFDAFFNTVVDQEWLQSDDPNAVALRGARQPGKKPPCWRVLHRVTFVSRIREDVADDGNAPAIVQVLRQLDIDSNFELIKQFEPYVSDHLDDPAAFARAIEARIQSALPELEPHRGDITTFLTEHFGVSSQPVAGAGHDDAFGEASFLEPAVNTAPAVAIPGDAKRIVVLDRATPELPHPSRELELMAQVTDDRLQADAVFLTWQAPAPVMFSDSHAIKPKVTFIKRGRYDIKVTADDGKLTGVDTITVRVNEPPLVAIDPPGDPTKDGDNWTLQLTGAIVDDGRADDTSDSGTVTLKWTCSTVQTQPVFSDGTQRSTKVTFKAPGLYILHLEATNGDAFGSAEVTVTIASRVFSGLQAFYTFEKGQGNVLEDVSGAGTDINLTFDLTKAEWLPGGLRVNSADAIQSSGASRLATGIRASGEFTLEAWVEPGAVDDGQLTTIASLGTPDQRCLALAEIGNICVTAAGTTASEPNGSGQALACGSLARGRLNHVVTTMQGSRLRIYIDGREVGTRIVEGDLSAWNSVLSSAQLGLAADGWLGILRLVAVYDRALTAAEVTQNFGIGPDVDLAPIVNAGGDFDVDWTDLTQPSVHASLQGRVTHDRPPLATAAAQWAHVSGPAEARISPPTDPRAGITFSKKGRYVLRLTATDGRLASIDDVAITVHQRPQFTIDEFRTLALEQSPLGIDLQIGALISGAGVEVSPPTFAWRQLSGPQAGLTGVDQPAAHASIDQRGVYAFSVTVDNGRLRTTRTTTVTVLTRPAAAIVGAPQTLALPELAAAAGVGGGPSPVAQGSSVVVHSVVLDSGGAAANTLTFAWAASGPGPVGISDPNLDTTRLTFTESGVYSINMTVSNAVLSTTVPIPIVANRPPVVDAGLAQTLTGRPIARLSGFIADDGLRQGRVIAAWSAQGPANVVFENAASTSTRARFFKAGDYVLSLRADDGNAARSDSTTVTVASKRETAGLVSFYPMDEPSGADIRDAANGTTPVTTIASLAGVTREPGGGLRIRQAAQGGVSNPPTVIAGQTPHDILVQAIRAQGQFSVEVWIAPARLDAFGATVLSLGGTPAGIGGQPPKVDFALIQRGSSMALRLRPLTDGGTPPEVTTAVDSLTTQMTQLVCTAVAAGDNVDVTFFIDGKLSITGGAPCRVDDFEAFRLALANDITLSSPWFGVLGSVALFSRALGPDDVLQNFVAGPR